MTSKAIDIDISNLSPSAVSAYLRANGWTREREQMPSTAAIWTKGDEFEVLLPLRPEYLDFRRRMLEMIDTLRRAEQRPTAQVVADVASSGFDVVRVRLISPETKEGTLLLDEAADIVARSRDLLLAAACSTVQPKMCYSSRKPREASEYLRRLRLGQTERGSFVLSILSPVAPLLASKQADLDMPEPFDRRTLETLLSGVSAARDAAINPEDISAFESAVERGVSANLCEALAGLTGYDDPEYDVEISFSWALTRPKHNEQLHIAKNSASVIRQAAEMLKAKAPEEDCLVIGPVIILNRPHDADEGRAVVLMANGTSSRRVSVELRGADYQQALIAHTDRSLISMVGTLEKDRRSHTLRNPRDIQLLKTND
jgi:hypothetical protein